ncbi:MAG TPA: SAM-dependent methyltransferase [Pyrinomonadaceae bacterium]|jgi:SAM-dependent MidA family methyltransferase|nr:SAM-dependent methyltransferase [Pyrinomonadaceae bacterium]
MNERADGQAADATLAGRLRARIEREGALTFRDWMQAALYDGQEGYYCRPDRQRWGRAGDYRTSAETSPLFAATFANYFAALHKQLGSPKPFTILEAGAGAGDFAHGILDTLQSEQGAVFEATRYVVDEASADARERARTRLKRFGDRVEFKNLARLNPSTLEGVIFSNELLDALPVHRVLMRGGALFELCVGLADGGGFKWVEREPTTARLTEHFAVEHISLAEGQIAEVNLAAEDWIERAASILRRGYVVTVDYGAESAELYGATHRREGTLRAFRSHRMTPDVLAQAGTQDLTTTVNWTQVRRAGERAHLRTVLFERQDEFLLRAGLLDYLERMMNALPDEASKLSLRLSAREMILPNGMSGSFQVLVQEKR